MGFMVSLPLDLGLTPPGLSSNAYVGGPTSDAAGPNRGRVSGLAFPGSGLGFGVWGFISSVPQHAARIRFVIVLRRPSPRPSCSVTPIWPGAQTHARVI